MNAQIRVAPQTPSVDFKVDYQSAGRNGGPLYVRRGRLDVRFNAGTSVRIFNDRQERNSSGRPTYAVAQWDDERSAAMERMMTALFIRGSVQIGLRLKK